jgi:hypothetical protein
MPFATSEVTWFDLLFMLVWFWSPVYITGALAQLVVLRCMRVDWRRATLTMIGSSLVAVALTLAVWWVGRAVSWGTVLEPALGWLNRVFPSLSSYGVLAYLQIAVFITPPALVASTIVFPIGGWLTLRARGPSRRDGIEGRFRPNLPLEPTARRGSS